MWVLGFVGVDAWEGNAWTDEHAPFPYFFEALCCVPLLLGVKIKIVATRCQILRLKFNFGWGASPDPTE